jgi:serine/threonine-protein kinase
MVDDTVTRDAFAVGQPGSTVRLSVYDEPEMVEVRDYTGETYDSAKSGLEAVGFEVSRTDVDSDKPEGEVVAQDPKDGEAVKGSTVELEVSNGANEPMDMPDVIGDTESQARSALERAGHIGEIRVETREVDDDDDADRVIRTNPEAGDGMRRSATVTLIVGEHTDDNDDDNDDDDDNGNGGGPGRPPGLPGGDN